MTEFILNKDRVRFDQSAGLPLADLIRDWAMIKGTKTGCWEGDCGSCTVLMGIMDESGQLVYRSIVSCLTPSGLAHGTHIVTIEGLEWSASHPLIREMAGHHATQCGFCSPGIMMSLAAAILDKDRRPLKEHVAGNICRCTGYDSILKAAKQIEYLLMHDFGENTVENRVREGLIPSYFLGIPNKLSLIKPQTMKNGKPVGGGTDLMLKEPEVLGFGSVHYTLRDTGLRDIRVSGKRMTIGAGVSFTELMHHNLVTKAFPAIQSEFLLISSGQVRNTATIGGNLANASPIADLAIWLLALEADIELRKGREVRQMPLSDFFISYRKTALQPGEIILSVSFELPANVYYCSFEKVSKRQYLDIASVNSACLLTMDGDRVQKMVITAGGVAPVPLVLNECNAFLKGKFPDPKTIAIAVKIALSEIKPIDDVRGSKAYKRLLLRQLIYAHFLKHNLCLIHPSELSIE